MSGGCGHGFELIGRHIRIGLFAEGNSHQHVSGDLIRGGLALNRNPLLNGLTDRNHHVSSVNLEVTHIILANEIVVPHLTSNHSALGTSIPVVRLIPLWVQILLNHRRFALFLAVNSPLDKGVFNSQKRG